MFGLCRKYEELLTKYQDPRVKGWFLVDRLEYPFLIIVFYLFFSLKLGPWLMRNRKPFDLKRLMQVYNVSQIIINFHLFLQVIIFMWKIKFNFVCQPFFNNTTPAVMKIMECMWVYYLVKISDVIDTVFFVLRKKEKQISFLHLYHHTAMIFFSHLGVLFFPDGGHAILLGLFNTIIHVIMYTYYTIASLGPEYQKYVWWKKHLTGIQLLQFLIIWIHNFQALFRECDFPKPINCVFLLEASIFIYLFGKFYMKTYKSKANKENINTTKNGRPVVVSHKKEI